MTIMMAQQISHFLLASKFKKEHFNANNVSLLSSSRNLAQSFIFDLSFSVDEFVKNNAGNNKIIQKMKTNFLQ